MIRFKNQSSCGFYNVLIDGKVIGEVWSMYKYGYKYWRNGDGVMYLTRKEASEKLAEQKGFTINN